MIRRLPSVLVALAIVTAAACDRAPSDRRLESRFRDGVATLADDAMEGRGLGTEGIERAAEFIEGELRELGLEPAFEGGYRQPFEVRTGVVAGPRSRLANVARDDWTPLAMSSPGTFEGELVFAGYGISAPAIGFDELEGLDLDGKVVLMLRYEPQEKDDGSPFAGRRPSRWSSLRYRVHVARERGAVAVVFARGPAQSEGRDPLPDLSESSAESPAGLPVLEVRGSVAARWLGEAGIDVAAFQRDVDRDLSPRSEPLGRRLEGEIALEETRTSTSNVAGVLPGRGALASECVVVGAHYDHLGYGGDGSLRPNETAIHNGADDNASGTMGTILIADLVRRELEDADARRAIVFALFTAEESGLLGSAWFVEHAPCPAGSTRAMINLDMIGRLRESGLVALGSDTAPEWADAVERAAEEADLDVATRGDGYGPSDQTSFYAEGIPVLHLFTGAHDEYHTPEDDPDTVETAGAVRIVRFAAALTRELGAGALTPTYVRASSAPMMGGDSRGFRSYLGTIPDYGEMESPDETGVLLADVRPGGPADLAGLRGGDRIVEMAGTKVANLYDMTFVLQDHRPGETIGVAVVRDGERLALRATLGKRGSTPVVTEDSEDAADAHAASVAAAHGEPDDGTPTGETDALEPFELPEYFRDRPGSEFRIRAGRPFPSRADEPHLADVRQLTFGGENAEAYFSPDGRSLVYQATPPGAECDQQFVLDLATGDVRLVSDGAGRTTCGYYDWPEADRIVYASTRGGGDACPAPPDRSSGYVWPLYDTFDLWSVPVGGGAPTRMTDSPGYDAEATWCHRGGKIVFTSVRDGDLDLYVLDEAGETTRLTDTPGYDGGAFFNADCTEIVWRASRPEGEALEDYRALLERGLVRPNALELFVMKADGSDVRQVTSNGAANFGPYFHPDGRRIIYSSNHGTSSPREFDLWSVATTGDEPARVTSSPGFDGFPQFSPDGEFLVWGSNRANPEGRETNLFIARWIEEP